MDRQPASFIEAIRRHGRFYVEKASNSVLDGIRNVATRLKTGEIFFCEGCQDCIREFQLYRWDEKAGVDRPTKKTTTLWTMCATSSTKVFGPDIFSIGPVERERHYV